LPALLGAVSRGRGERGEDRLLEGKLATTAGTCGVMGTASTMACIAATLGFMPLPAASAPAVHADRLRMAEEAGAQAVRLISRPVPPAALVTAESVENAARVLLALGGSTNAVVHLAAIAGRAGLALDLARLDALSEETPVLVDLKPTGDGYMEDFHAAGGMRALLWELRDLLHLDTPDLDGVTLRDRIGDGRHFVDRRIIRARAEPVSPVGGIVTLVGEPGAGGRDPEAERGDPCPVRDRGALRGVRRARGPGEPIDDPDLDVTAGDLLVLRARAAEPGGDAGSGLPPIPKKLARAA
jgi:dihydroxy-acid dehydratase